MPYSLVPIIRGRPTPRSPRGAPEPLGLDQGGYSVHLGSDRALLWTPDPISDPRAVKLADDKSESLSRTARVQIVEVRKNDGFVMPPSFASAIAGLLVAPPDDRWNALTPTREGMLEIRLGPGTDNVIWSQPVVQGGVDMQDTFNRADAGLDGSTSSDAQFTWSISLGTAALANIVTNEYRATRSGSDHFAVALASLAMNSANHYAQVGVALSSPTGNAVGGVGVRITNGTAVSDSGYAYEVSDLGAFGRRVYDFPTDATLASDGGTTTSGTLYLEFNGSTYTAKTDGVTIFTGTDSAYAGGGSQRKTILAAFLSTADGAVTTFDNFRAADLAGAVTGDPGGVKVPFFRVRLRQY